MQAAALPAAASSAAQACSPASRRWKSCASGPPKLQKDCLAAQDRTDELKTQVDALAAELTATESEIITAAK